MRTRTNIFQNTDGVLIGLYLLLVLMGWLNIYAATYNEDFPSILDINQSYGRQLLWIGTSLVIGLVVLLMDSRFFQLFANAIYILCLVALAGVLVFGTEIKGAKSWFTLGSFSLQPSEFAKFGTALAIAKLLGNTQSKIKDLSTTLKAIALILPPALLILLQPDTGSTLVYVSFVFVLYREGLSGNFLLMGLLMIVLFVLALIIEPIDLTIAIAGIGIVVYAVLYNGWKFLLPATGLLTLLAVVVIRTDAPAVVMASGVALAAIVYAIVMYV
ncbi:MAG: rod shape-determining protein RodA, partial [Bacteroidota bacterium]